MPLLPAEIVDSHVHLFPDRLFDAIRRRFVTDYHWQVIHDFYWRDCIEHLREAGVGPIVYSNYAHKQGVARELNEWNREIIAETEKVFCFIAYHPADDDALTMADSLLSLPRVMGVKLQLLVQRFYPHDRRLFPLYDLIIEKGKYILFHVGTGPVGNEFVGVAHFQRLLDHYPNLPAIVAHMGGLEYREFGSLLSRYPQLYLDTSFSFLPQLGRMFDLGTDFLEEHRLRILYGSDFPNVLFPRETEINTLLGLGLSEEFYRRVFSDNARELICKCSGITDLPQPCPARS